VILDLDDPSKHLAGWKDVVEGGQQGRPDDHQRGARVGSEVLRSTPKASKLDGADVDVLSVEIPGLPKEARDGYVKRLGPDWNKVKMVTVDKQVVGLFGSDTDLLRKAVKNVKGGQEGTSPRTRPSPPT